MVLCEQYAKCIKGRANGMCNSNLDSISNKDAAIDAVNSMCDNVESVIHECCSTVLEAATKSHSRLRKRHWWNNDCLVSRDRQRLWFCIWVSCGRARQGHVYNNYKLAKKLTGRHAARQLMIL
jgi:hypothetical protein